MIFTITTSYPFIILHNIIRHYFTLYNHNRIYLFHHDMAWQYYYRLISHFIIDCNLCGLGLAYLVMDGLKDTIGGYVINWFHHLIILIRLVMNLIIMGLSHLTLSQHSIAFTFTIRWSGFIYLLFGQPYNMFINSSHPQSSAWAATCIYWISRHVIFGKRCKYSYRWGLSTKEWVIFYNWPIAWWDGGSWFRVNLKQLIS